MDSRRGQGGIWGKRSSTERVSKSGGSYRCSLCKESGHKWHKYHKRACSICCEMGHDPNTCLKFVKESDQLPSGDRFHGICGYAHSEYILDAFYVFLGVFGVDSGITEGLDFEVWKLKL